MKFKWYKIWSLLRNANIRKLNTSHKMKNINNKSFFNFIKSKGLILIASTSLLTSCVIYTGGYSETDGVYYDPNKDSLPAGTYGGNFGNQVDDYYNYQDTYPSIYDNNQQNLQQQQSRYNLATDSDWGTFTGTETNYNSFNNWGWGAGFGWGYPGYGMYGWNSPFNSWGWGLGFGWGWGGGLYSPWGWGGFYDPFWNAGWGWGGYYNGFYGYNQPIYYNRSGANGRLLGMIPQNRNTNGFRGINSSGFRTPERMLGNNGNIRNQNSGVRNYPNNGVRNYPNNGVRNYPNNGVRNYPNSGIRTSPNNSGIRNNYPNNGGIRNNSGIRNEGFNNSPSRSGSSGGFNSGGGFRGGSSGGGGGMRSGGGGRR